ncbi:MAG: hypothetical protein IJD13_08815 [Oscillospiraceae bacterium]|nr:hypothetical protein [Oscillospiraceae bacterium]
MKVKQIIETLNARLLVGEEFLDPDIETACGSDMMSDVLAASKAKDLLLTGLVNLQVVRTAAVVDAKCIVFVRGKVPDEDMLAIARRKDMVVLSTDLRMYNACGRLWEAGLKGGVIGDSD